MRGSQAPSESGVPSSFHQVLEDGLQVVVGRRDLVDGAEVGAGGHVGDARVERVGLAGLDHDGARLEAQAAHVDVVHAAAEDLPGDAARIRRADVDGVRMLVDQLADLVDVPFRENPAVVDEQDVRGHRLDLVQDVAPGDYGPCGGGPVAGQKGRLL